MSSEGVTLTEIRAAVDGRMAPHEPVTASEVADEVGCARQTASEKLSELAEHGDVYSKTIGDRRVWWQVGDTKSNDYDQFRTLVEAVEEYAIFTLDPDGHILTWNKGAKKIKGYDTDEIVGSHFSTFYTDEATAAGVPDRNLTVAAERGLTAEEGWRVRADGSQFWANVTITAVHDDDGNLKGYTKVTRDMTERREKEQALRKERDQTQELLKTSPVAISVKDADGTVLMANQRAQEVLGLSEQEIIDKPDNVDEWSIYDAAGEPLAPEKTPEAQTRATGEPVYEQEIAIERPDGERMWLSISTAPLFNADGALERIITTGEDITELKRRERQLERRKSELESELSEILGRISDAFYALDEEWRFTHVNERAEAIFGTSEEEVRGESIWELYPEATETTAWEKFHDAMETQEPTNFELYDPSLDAWLEVNAYPSGSGISVYFRDVTERVEYERALAESERRYRTLAEQFPNGGINMYDSDLRLTLVAGQAFEELEIQSGEFEGSTLQEAYGDVAAELEPAYQAALNGDDETVEIKYGGREWIIHTTPIHDEQGNISAGMAVAQDITERKEREQQLERFSSVVSHGLRNPLAIAKGYLQMAEENGDPADFAEVEQAHVRMETIIQNLLTMSQTGETITPPESTSFAPIVENAWQHVETMDATLQITATEGTVVADADRLQTAFENLFRNAVEHGGHDVTVRVGWLADGFFIEDTGTGMPESCRSAAFDYGYSEENGTGIGLAVVREIIDAHGWTITATESSSGGARFEVHGAERSEPNR